MGMQDVLFQLGLSFESPEALELSTRIQEHVYFAALTASNEIAKKSGPHTAFPETRAAKGDLQFDLWTENGKVRTTLDWEPLRESIKTHGLRNSLLLAIAPTATIASIVGSYESIEPQVSNLFKRETMSGEFLQVNRYLVERLRAVGLWDDQMIEDLKLSEGSIQHIDRIPQDIKDLFKTAWELSMKALIDQAAARGAFLDQSQSLNLFMESPNIGKLSSMYLYAWKKGLKTTYYMRSRPATRIAKATVGGGASVKSTPSTAALAPASITAPEAVESTTEKKTYSAEEAVVCSLENPESCEACT
jgi:ribonucleoside-diphosphate reductase alpha chain